MTIEVTVLTYKLINSHHVQRNAEEVHNLDEYTYYLISVCYYTYPLMEVLSILRCMIIELYSFP